MTSISNPAQTIFHSFLTDEQTDRQASKQTNKQTNKQTVTLTKNKLNPRTDKKKNCWIMLSCHQICTKLLYCQFQQKQLSEFCSCHVLFEFQQMPIRASYWVDAMWCAEIITLLYIWRKGMLLPLSFHSEYFLFRDTEICLAVFAVALVT